MTRPPLRLATRASALAMWQAEHVANLLMQSHDGLRVEIVPTSTEGDRNLDAPLSEIGGKGVFATEVQAAVLDGRADIAVHSAKDLAAVTSPGLVLAAIPRRGDPRDALVGATLEELPHEAVVATGSQRRRALLADLRPDLRFAELRGNMATRLAKAEQFDAIVVASVALDRLGLAEQITQRLAVDTFVPQVAQAALGVECRAEDTDIVALLGALDDPDTRRAVEVERAFLAELGGDCSLPAGAHATTEPGGGLLLRGVLAESVGGRLVRGSTAIDAASANNRSADGAKAGAELAARLRSEISSG